MTLCAKTSRCVPPLIALLIASCGGTREQVKGPGEASLPIAVDHEACDTESAGALKVDSNGDGRPDIVRVMSGGREVCRMVDLNHDGRPDTFTYFDSKGAIRRTESDFDRDGLVDEIAHYQGGVVVRKDRETNLDKKFDTWDFYEGGKMKQRLRDSDANGKIDQWWSWPNPDKLDCAVIASDHDGDGQPDPDSVVDVCAVGAVDGGAGPAAPPAASAPPDAAALAAPKADAGAPAIAAPVDAAPTKKGTGAVKKETK